MLWPSSFSWSEQLPVTMFMSEGYTKLTPPLISWSTQDYCPCTLPWQHSRTGTGGGSVIQCQSSKCIRAGFGPCLKFQVIWMGNRCVPPSLDFATYGIQKYWQGGQKRERTGLTLDLLQHSTPSIMPGQKSIVVLVSGDMGKLAVIVSAWPQESLSNPLLDASGKRAAPTHSPCQSGRAGPDGKGAGLLADWPTQHPHRHTI